MLGGKKYLEPLYCELVPFLVGAFSYVTSVVNL